MNLIKALDPIIILQEITRPKGHLNHTIGTQSVKVSLLEKSSKCFSQKNKLQGKKTKHKKTETLTRQRNLRHMLPNQNVALIWMPIQT